MTFFNLFAFENLWCFLLTAVIAYLLGSINTAVLVTKIVTKGKQDIRNMGSGNAGFTNVLRSVGKIPAIITIVCDALKCVLAVFVGWFIFSLIQTDSLALASEFVNSGKYIAGIFCILGHSYPIYFHFKGGKGVVTSAALIASVEWRVFLLVLATFLIVFLFSKIISLSSITSAVMYPIYTFIVTFVFEFLPGNSSLPYAIFSTISSLIIGVFVIVKHKDNISRLIKGEEKKITSKKA